ncbi:MAG: MFS transporter [Planctomycetes bacterium]|nr:MFS transporter [Planctomycetota bacterium]
MAVDRSKLLDAAFLAALESTPLPCGSAPALDAPLAPTSSLTGRMLLELFESQVVARHLDLEARELKRRNEGFYTIGSSGHEGNVVLGRLVRETDPAFLHYRSGALMVERARQRPGATPIFDVLLSLVASSDDPVSGGRHKVFGSPTQWVPPQTSTIASHLPKSLGCAFGIERARALGLPLPIPVDSIVLCNFGDAGSNHNVAQGSFNTAAWCAHQHLPLPLLFVCEDNGIGISVRTPQGWIAKRMSAHPGIHYVAGDGLDLQSAFDAAQEAVEHCRTRRRPVFLHLRTVRLLGHAGSDVESEYRTRADIEATEAVDPLVASARMILALGLDTPAGLREQYESVRRRVAAAAREAASRPKLMSAAEVIAPLAPLDSAAIAAEAARVAEPAMRLAQLPAGEVLPELSDRPRHLAVQLNRVLHEVLLKDPATLLFGEDVARKGGVYHVTSGLAETFGDGRVFNTLLDETSILGLAVGAAHLGFVTMPEIQYLAYLHNAEDQLRGEACSLQFFSKGAFRNPMVVRIAALGYQKGFGGHFHNDSSTAVVRDIPGLVVALPCRGDDAVLMLRTAHAAARVNGAVVAFLEPIALYMTKDLYADGDGLWLTSYPAPGESAAIGSARVHADGEGADICVITYGNGVWLSLRAARRLRKERGCSVRVLDLRWLRPLDRATIVAEARRAGRVLIVDEGRRSGGVHESVAAVLLEELQENMPRVFTVCAEDTYTPLGPAANTVLPSEDGIFTAALRLVSAARGGVA